MEETTLTLRMPGRDGAGCFPLPTRIGRSLPAKSLIDAGHIVVAVGGGGIPVVSTDEGFSGVPAVDR